MNDKEGEMRRQNCSKARLGYSWLEKVGGELYIVQYYIINGTVSTQMSFRINIYMYM